jgi:L,D-peptidoglycan transpeptidase YkuD (ErfK/YbiS/YcfS/YnhG family)
VAALAVVFSAPAAPAASCNSNLVSALAAGRSASQLVTVVAANASSTTGSMRLWGRSGGCWHETAGPWRVYLGFAGVSEHHHEGDGTTPAGAFAIGPVMYGVSPNPGVHFAYHQLVCGDWWDEDPASPAYNTFQHVPCGTAPPFRGSSEPLWRSPGAYAHLAFLEYNSDPAVPGRGSAIFIHADLGHPTNGCISLPPAELVSLLDWLDPAAHPLVVAGTAAEVRSF